MVTCNIDLRIAILPYISLLFKFLHPKITTKIIKNLINFKISNKYIYLISNPSAPFVVAILLTHYLPIFPKTDVVSVPNKLPYRKGPFSVPLALLLLLSFLLSENQYLFAFIMVLPISPILDFLFNSSKRCFFWLGQKLVAEESPQGEVEMVDMEKGSEQNREENITVVEE